MRIRLALSFPVLSFLLLSTCSPAATSLPSPTVASALYREQLHARCADKHLEMLSPAALSDIHDAFMPHFNASQRRTVQSAITRSCRGIDMGATCGNIGFLRAAISLHKLDTFTTHVCATRQRCTDYSNCTDIK